jgi:hypothetical protein
MSSYLEDTTLGAAFQVLLEVLSEIQGFEGRIELDSPRCVFGCVEALAGIVFGQPAFEIGRMATVELRRFRDALEGIRIPVVPSARGTAKCPSANQGAAFGAAAALTPGDAHAIDGDPQWRLGEPALGWQ